MRQVLRHNVLSDSIKPDQLCTGRPASVRCSDFLIFAAGGSTAGDGVLTVDLESVLFVSAQAIPQSITEYHAKELGIEGSFLVGQPAAGREIGPMVQFVMGLCDGGVIDQ